LFLEASEKARKKVTKGKHKPTQQEEEEEEEDKIKAQQHLIRKKVEILHQKRTHPTPSLSPACAIFFLTHPSNTSNASASISIPILFPSLKLSFYHRLSNGGLSLQSSETPLLRQELRLGSPWSRLRGCQTPRAQFRVWIQRGGPLRRALDRYPRFGSFLLGLQWGLPQVLDFRQP